MIAKQEPELTNYHAAAGMSTAMAAIKVDAPPAYETWDSCDLYDHAQDMQVMGYAFMTKTELIAALRLLSRCRQ